MAILGPKKSFIYCLYELLENIHWSSRAGKGKPNLADPVTAIWLSYIAIGGGQA